MMAELRQPVWLKPEEVPPLPEGWRALPTEEACVQLKPGKLFDKRTVAEKASIPVLSQGEAEFIGFHDEEPGVEASREKPVVTFANHTCAMRLMKQPFSTIQNIFPKVGKPGVTDTVYFFYASLGRVNLSDYKGHHPIFRQAHIPVPPLPVQRRIASILSAYDDLIENNRQRISILEQMARALYREWFVRPCQSGKLPSGWEVKTLGQIVENFDRLRKPLSKLKRAEMQGAYPYYGAAKVFDHVNDFIFDGEYLLMAEDGSVITTGRAPVLQLVNEKFWPNNHTHVLRGKPPISTHFLYLGLWDVDISPYITGAAQPKITQENMNRIPFFCGPAQLHQEFNRLVAPTIRQGQILQRQNQNLRRTRDLLLPRLMSGQIDVSRWADEPSETCA